MCQCVGPKKNINNNPPALVLRAIMTPNTMPMIALKLGFGNCLI